MKHTTIAVDIAKSVFELAVSYRAGRVDETYRLRRSQLLKFFAQRQPATVVLEACGSAHHWARQLRQLGHTVVLLPPVYVKPYVRRNKTDRADAAALLEAHRNKDIHPVPVKTVEQQSLATLHRVRSAWMTTRTARINAARGLLREFGIFIPIGSRKLVPHVTALIEDAEAPVPDSLRHVLHELCDEIRALEARVHEIEFQLDSLAKQMPVVKQLMTVPGIGLLTATALVAIVGTIHRFRSCRHFASFLGLTPSERSSGLRRHLGSISKKGDAYLRTLLTHGARAVLNAAKRTGKTDRIYMWALTVESRRGHNKAVVALANKIARIVYSILKHDQNYKPEPLAA